MGKGKIFRIPLLYLLHPCNHFTPTATDILISCGDYSNSFYVPENPKHYKTSVGNKSTSNTYFKFNIPFLVG
jgi:hypothetical protein